MKPDYCLFFANDFWWLCHSKDEWAAWAQAIGAILAVLVAIGVPYRQQVLRDAKEQARQQARMNAARLLVRVTLSRVFPEFRLVASRFNAALADKCTSTDCRILSCVDLVPRLEACWDQVEYLEASEGLELASILSVARDYQTSMERVLAKIEIDKSLRFINTEIDKATMRATQCADAAERLHDRIVDKTTRRITFEVNAQ